MLANEEEKREETRIFFFVLLLLLPPLTVPFLCPFQWMDHSDATAAADLILLHCTEILHEGRTDDEG